MQSLKILPNIKYLLQNNKEEEAINIINPIIDTLALYLQDSLSLFSGSTKESSLCLSKIHFILQNYDQSIHYAINAGDLFLQDKTFYFKAIVDRMMACLLEDNNHFCKEFVLQLIKDDDKSDSLIGFLYSIKEYSLINNNKDLINELLKIDSSMLYDSIIKNNNYSDKESIFLLVDAYFHFNRKDDITALILDLEKRDLSLCYTTCFYISDTYRLALPNINNDKISYILSGKFKKDVFSKFMLNNNITSFKFLDSIAKARSPYISLVNAFMNLGTTNDTFYRNNSDIFSNMKEWARYTDIANIGMIHFNNENPYDVLRNYIPNESTNKEGGSLQALGLINHCKFDDNELLLYFIENDLTEELAFGACLGLGLINLGSNDFREKLMKLYKEKNTIYGEAAAIGLGLLGCGSQDFKGLVFDSEYERVNRNSGIAYALISSFSKVDYNVNDSDNNDIDNVFGYVLSLGTSFVGTGDLQIISKLLPYINHEDDDVKRNAVISLSLVSCLDKELLFNVLNPLAENHNFAVRSGVALTLGFFFSGTGDNRVCDLLEGLMYDTNSLVKQSALMGMGFVLMQCNKEIVKNYKRIINKINKVIIDRGEETSVKYGAMVGRGISEAGGRNIIFSITNLHNKITKERLVGCVMFFTHWYWYPFINFIALNMKETGFFVFDKDLNLVEKKLSYKGNYDNVLIKVPDIKKSRKFKAKPVVEEEITTKAKEEVISGERCTLLQMEELGLEFPGVFFINE